MTESLPGAASQTAAARFAEQPVLLGLFLPCLDGGWTISSAPRGTNWSFAYNLECLRLVEELGFDFTFQVGQWLPGYGGQIRYREKTLEPLIATAGFAARTSHCFLISTVHVLYGLHPVFVAKQGAVIDEISEGRWGINVVAGFDENERKMFGLPPITHDDRYRRADEFMRFTKRLWTEEEPFDFAGEFYQGEGCFIAPKPIQKPFPLIVSAGISPAGRDFAARHSDLLFVTNPVEGGPNPRDYAALKQVNQDVKDRAARQGRALKTIINPHVICRETESEAWRVYQTIVDHGDPVAVQNFLRHLSHGNQSWPAWSVEHAYVGGNVILVGTPEQILDQFRALRDAGCDGFQLTFFDYHPDIRRFGELIMPLMQQAGWRASDDGRWATDGG